MLERYLLTYRAWRYRLRAEPDEIALVLRQLKPGDVAVDIGAHKGAFTYWMNHCVGSTGRVFAFEPQPLLAEQLQRLTARWTSRVTVKNAALSSQAGEVTLHVPSRQPSPGASLENRAGWESYRVPATTLDEFFLTSRSTALKVNFIKCDAEGHELEIFRGGRQLLMEQRPTLLFECEARHRRHQDVARVFDFLFDLGYVGYFLADGGLYPVSQFDLAIHQADPNSPAYINNFAFLPSPVTSQRQAA